MSITAERIDLPREIARTLVDRAERQTGSRMVAYRVVASTVGTTAGWLRKFINGSEAKEPGWSIGMNLVDCYNRMCERVEAEIETERVKILALKRQVDAVTTPVDRVVETAMATEVAGTEEVK